MNTRNSARTQESGWHSRACMQQKDSQTGTRTRVAWVKATYPNRLDYLGAQPHTSHTPKHKTKHKHKHRHRHNTHGVPHHRGDTVAHSPPSAVVDRLLQRKPVPVWNAGAQAPNHTPRTHTTQV